MQILENSNVLFSSKIMGGRDRQTDLNLMVLLSPFGAVKPKNFAPRMQISGIYSTLPKFPI